jgi:hypothetical protein
MKVIIAFRSRQHRKRTKYMCRTVNIQGLTPNGLNPATIFRYLLESNKQKLPGGLGISALKRLQIKVYKLSYWSVLGLITIKIPFTGNIKILPSFAKKEDHQYFIKYHSWYRATTGRCHIVRNGRVLLLTKRIFSSFGKRYF